MNILKINRGIRSWIAFSAILIMWACADDSKAPVVTYDSAGKGAYVKVLSKTGALLLNLLSQSAFDASSFGYSVEFVDGQGGARVQRYVLKVEYVDVNDVNSSGPIELKSFESSEFTQMESGRLGIGSITVTSADVVGKFGLTYASLTPGDQFIITGELVTNEGTFTSDNSSATVNGEAFQGFFDFTMPAACPSDLAGTFNYTATNYWCDGTGGAGTVKINALGGGKYSFSDWSFGGYKHCYGGNAAGWGALSFTEVCTVVSFTGFKDNYGETWTFTSSISGNDWIINWSNTYVDGGNGNEAGSVSINFPSGVPFTLK